MNFSSHECQMFLISKHNIMFKTPYLPVVSILPLVTYRSTQLRLLILSYLFIVRVITLDKLYLEK